MSALQTVRLNPVDAARARAIASSLASRHESMESAVFLRQARVLADDLPRSIRWALNSFRVTEEQAACLITGMPMDDAALGPTPDRFGGQASAALTLEHDIFFFLCGALLGDAIGWETQQEGRLMHDSLAVRAGARIAVPARRVRVPWHTEDTSHPCRADYVGLMCLRDPDEIPTTFASIGDVRLDPADVDVLFEPRFPLSSTDPHLAIDPGEAAARGEVEHIALLFGDRDRPYLRIDPYLMPAMSGDPVGAAALERLVAALNAAVARVVLRPGEVLFVDNYRAVHGRQAFKPRFDGTGRWLKGLNIVRDLRKSRPLRHGVEGRVIHGR